MPSRSATATSHTLGKVLERQPHRLTRYFCQELQLCIFTRRGDILQLHLTLQNNLDILSSAIESPAFLAKALLEACQQIQLRVDDIVSTIALHLDVPTGENCLPLLALWDRSDSDGEGFSTSSRNAGAIELFCTHLVHLERQVACDIGSIRALEEVLIAFRRLQSADRRLQLEPSLPKKLYEKIDSVLSLRLSGEKESNALAVTHVEYWAH